MGTFFTYIIMGFKARVYPVLTFKTKYDTIYTEIYRNIARRFL